MNDYINYIPNFLHILLVFFYPINHLSNNYFQQRIYLTVESPLNWQKNPAKWHHYLLYFLTNITNLILIIMIFVIGYKLRWIYSIYFVLETFFIPLFILNLLKMLLIRFFENGDYFYWGFKPFIGKIRLFTIAIIDFTIICFLLKFSFNFLFNYFSYETKKNIYYNNFYQSSLFLNL